mmetsp:Transcript_38271/g.114584  ORF Transcript_38271/g.114584 Transcript_38271/m.114584 type:complete len:235 (-) Transcript_38271:212-916(-)
MGGGSDGFAGREGGHNDGSPRSRSRNEYHSNYLPPLRADDGRRTGTTARNNSSPEAGREMSRANSEELTRRGSSLRERPIESQVRPRSPRQNTIAKTVPSRRRILEMRRARNQRRLSPEKEREREREKGRAQHPPTGLEARGARFSSARALQAGVGRRGPTCEHRSVPPPPRERRRFPEGCLPARPIFLSLSISLDISARSPQREQYPPAPSSGSRPRRRRDRSVPYNFCRLSK